MLIKSVVDITLIVHQDGLRSFLLLYHPFALLVYLGLSLSSFQLLYHAHFLLEVDLHLSIFLSLLLLLEELVIVPLVSQTALCSVGLVVGSERAFLPLPHLQLFLEHLNLLLFPLLELHFSFLELIKSVPHILLRLSLVVECFAAEDALGK
mmetsp:Transcript_22803/g.22018  ORF Transcript_22803/g.22018 Transcript_22803/m.22018 type:complete len:151 (+) Transcript_22803:913-1365(+)